MSLLFWFVAQEPRYWQFLPLTIARTLHQDLQKKKWPYLRSWATNQKTKVTFFYSTFIVWEIKVSLLFWFVAQKPRYGQFLPLTIDQTLLTILFLFGKKKYVYGVQIAVEWLTYWFSDFWSGGVYTVRKISRNPPWKQGMHRCNLRAKGCISRGLPPSNQGIPYVLPLIPREASPFNHLYATPLFEASNSCEVTKSCEVNQVNHWYAIHLFKIFSWSSEFCEVNQINHWYATHIFNFF